MKIGSLPIYYAARTSADLYFMLHGGLRALNPENVPREGGVIVASNHMSHLDPLALASAARHRRLLAMAKEELFHNKAFGWLIANIGAFPIKRGEADTEAVRFAMQVLEAGHSLIVFPEGTRSDGKTMLPVERGVGMLAKKTGVPVVPIGIHGTQLLMPRDGKGVARHLVTVACGEPFTYADVATGPSEKANRELFAHELERRIREQVLRAGFDIKTASSG